MSAITKLELTQLLQARNTELEAARLRIAELEGDVAALKNRAPAVFGRHASTYVARQASPEQLAFRAKLAAAKAEAQRSGCTVKVA